MALITCYECGAEISDQAKTCPKCGAGQTKRARAAADKKAKRAAALAFAQTPEGKRKKRRDLFVGLLVLAGIFLAFRACARKDVAPPEAQQAFRLCANTIKQQLPGANVPLAVARMSKGEIYFAWPGDKPDTTISAKNASGAVTGHTASCITGADGSTITVLTLDGKAII